MSSDYCSYCYKEMPKWSTACPHCGSDLETGWSENTYMDGVDTVGGSGYMDDEDYDDYVRRDFGQDESSGPRWWIVVAALAVVVGMLWWSVGG